MSARANGRENKGDLERRPACLAHLIRLPKDPGTLNILIQISASDFRPKGEKANIMPWKGWTPRAEMGRLRNAPRTRKTPAYDDDDESE